LKKLRILGLGIALSLISSPVKAQEYLYISANAEQLVYGNICSAYRGGTSAATLLDYARRWISSSAEPGMPTVNLSVEQIRLLYHQRDTAIINKAATMIRSAIYDDACRQPT
jgi:hypothetical protein